ncbi:zinc finger and SCAN domain-containing protein 29-like [Mauremys reevesii]|uniref:zinc finger and SCAN domain-containing protein 29-like n=1 Tax=Mauremys reevesii TaxID=260615 RepID=UPI00193FC25E|nr:zinc finger and SCAN domain-containing protein 29-like [Mauremys reevesii]
MDLIVVWGEESVQAELQFGRRNADICAKIAQGMGEKGYTRDTQQCCMKIKELRQTYQKTRKANSCSGSEPQTCRFYEELHALLSCDPTTTPKRFMDTSQELLATSGNNKEDTVNEKEEEEEEIVSQARGGSILPDSQELFLTLEPIPSQDQLLAECDAREGTFAETLSVGTSSTLGQRLSQF